MEWWGCAWLAVGKQWVKNPPLSGEGSFMTKATETIVSSMHTPVVWAKCIIFVFGDAQLNAPDLTHHF